MQTQPLLYGTVTNYIGGQWTAFESNARIMDVESPLDGRVIARLVMSTDKDLDDAVAAAKAAFQHGDLNDKKTYSLSGRRN